MLRLPVNKSVAEVNGRPVRLEGVTVYNGREIFVPRDALPLLSGVASPLP
ncbi:MAG: hypothetical protein ACPLRW_01260 [Moorellales bacterium]